MKLVVGLGNPGKEYENTRHNIGFQLLDYIAKDKGLEFSREKFNGKYVEYNVNSEKVILVKPMSYMNLSGNVVSSFANFYKIDVEDILVIQDDLDMNFGRVKIVNNSSSGGHNGIKDIEKFLGSRFYSRLKIGISNDKSFDTKDYVLGKFNSEEMAKLQVVYNNLKDVIDDFCNISLENLKSKYNNK